MHILNPITDKKIMAFLVLSSLIIFFCLRLFQGFGYVSSYFRNLLDIVLFKRLETYDPKMFQEMGLRYLYPKKIVDITPAHSVICFWKYDPLLDAGVDAYFLYPRVVKRMSDPERGVLDQIKKEGCEYLILNNGLPNFDLKVKKIILFDDKFDGEPIYINPANHLYKSVLYADKTGLIQL